MSFKILNQIIKVWERIKGDTQSKIALGVLSSGVMLIGVAPFTVTLFFTSNEGNELSIGALASDSERCVQIFGYILLLVGMVLCIHRYIILHRLSGIKNIALFFIPGFDNINENLPVYALPTNVQKKIKDVKFKKISSYIAQEIIDEYSFYTRTINNRLEHNSVEKAYLAALGSVPFLYLVGTLFRNGHLPVRVLEHERSSDKWHLLDDVGPNESLDYSYKGVNRAEKISEVLPNSKNEIALSISFTNEIMENELPEEIREHTLKIRLNSGFRFDALPAEPIQDQIVKELAHIITTLAKKANKVHLFICAQASVILKLGKLYQDNMSGIVVIHNYNSKQKRYNWAIEFNRGIPVIYNQKNYT